jgi:predicted nucleotidyltransferase component of viral defense system
VQINFVEQMYFTPKNGQLSGLLTGKEEALESLFPKESAEYARKIPFAVYDIREILCEKVRALLTRQGTKARDFVDVYLIMKTFGIKSEDDENVLLKLFIDAYGRKEADDTIKVCQNASASLCMV